MESKPNLSEKVFNSLLSERIRKKSDDVIVTIAIVSFLVHLLLILLVDLEILVFSQPIPLLENPIAAIYTPFSFILIYEVYLLVYYLPKSTSNYIGKQYEIITLIVIRRIFKDLSNLDLSTSWFQDPDDLQFTYDLLTTLILFLLIYFFHRLNKKPIIQEQYFSKELKTFINRKKLVAIVLVPIFLFMALYTLGNWTFENAIGWNQGGSLTIDLNTIFFDQFFTILILTDVLLLLFSLFHTDEFRTVIRNSGFIISTILIRISFSTEGLLNDLLVLVAVSFGVIILYIHNQYSKIQGVG